MGSREFRCVAFPPGFGEFLARVEGPLSELTGPLKQLWCQGSLAAAVTSPQAETWASQKAWTEALDSVTSGWLDNEVSCRLSSLKRLQSGAHSGAWLVSLPLERHAISAFSPSEWRVLLRFRCGVPLLPRARCGGCDAVMDTFGDHALSCASCGRYARHNRLRQAVAFEYEQAGQPFRLEVELPGQLSRPADILAVEPEEASPAAVDVSVVHPLRPSAAPAASAEVVPGASAEAREAEKLAAAGGACAAAGWRFVPLCADTTGAWGPRAKGALRRLIRLQSMKLGQPVKAVAAIVWRMLAVAVAKGAAQCLLRAFPGFEAHCSPGEAESR